MPLGTCHTPTLYWEICTLDPFCSVPGMSAFDLTVFHLCKHLKHVWKYSHAVSSCSKNDTTATTLTGLLLPTAAHRVLLVFFSFANLNILLGSMHLFIHPYMILSLTVYAVFSPVWICVISLIFMKTPKAVYTEGLCPPRVTCLFTLASPPPVCLALV